MATTRTPTTKLPPTVAVLGGRQLAAEDHRTSQEKEMLVARFKPMPCKVGDLIVTSGHISELEDGLFLVCATDVWATFVGGN